MGDFGSYYTQVQDQYDDNLMAASCKVLLAGTLSKKVLGEVTEGVHKLQRAPLLVGFLSSSDPAARVYAEWTAKTARENGFSFDLREVDREGLEDALLSANKDAKVDGIIVYYPIFGDRQDQYLQQIVDVNKDVEGLCHKYVFNMYQNIRFLDEAKQKKSILPCTPLAILKILEHLQIYNSILPYENRLHGRTITVINRSEVVGRPLAALLANDGARVYSVDIKDVQEFHRGSGLRKRRHEVTELPGWTMENCLPLSDVVISGVPGDKFKVPLHLLRDGAVCINFSSEKNFAPEVKEKASIYIPAIGKVTIAVLLRNLLRLVTNKTDEQRQSTLNGAATQEQTVPSLTAAQNQILPIITPLQKQAQPTQVASLEQTLPSQTEEQKQSLANGTGRQEKVVSAEMDGQKQIVTRAIDGPKQSIINIDGPKQSELIEMKSQERSVTIEKDVLEQNTTKATDGPEHKQAATDEKNIPKPSVS